MCAALLSWLAVVVPVVCGCSCNKLAGYECSCSSFRCRSFDVVSLVAVVGVSVVVVVGVVFVFVFVGVFVVVIVVVESFLAVVAAVVAAIACAAESRTAAFLDLCFWIFVICRQVAQGQARRTHPPFFVRSQCGTMRGAW